MLGLILDQHDPQCSRGADRTDAMAIVALSARLLPLGGVSYLAWGKNAPPRGRSLGDPPEALSSCREYETEHGGRQHLPRLIDKKRQSDRTNSAATRTRRAYPGGGRGGRRCEALF